VPSWATLKLVIPNEAEAKRQRAVGFLRRIGQDDDADRSEAMNACGYAEHKGVELRENPTKRQVTLASEEQGRISKPNWKAEPAELRVS
jgi:hypothetical protein